MTEQARTWNRLIALHALLAIGAAVLACWPAWQDIYRYATSDPDHGYIVLVPAVAGWLALCRRRRLRSAGRRGLWLGPAIVVIAGFVYLLGGSVPSTALLHLGAVGVLVGAIWSVVGRSVMLRMTPAVVALFFLAPVPMAWLLPITDVLGSWSVALAAVVLETLGVAAAANGRELIIGSSGVSLGEDAGVRMIAAIGLVTYAYVFGAPLRHGVRIALVLASPLVAVVANVVRIVPYALIAEHWAEPTRIMAQMSGWLTLLLAFAMLYGGLRLLRYVHVPARRYALAYQ